MNPSFPSAHLSFFLDLFRIAPSYRVGTFQATAAPGDRLCQPQAADHHQVGFLTQEGGRREDPDLLVADKSLLISRFFGCSKVLEANTNPYCVGRVYVFFFVFQALTYGLSY